MNRQMLNISAIAVFVKKKNNIINFNQIKKPFKKFKNNAFLILSLIFKIKFDQIYLFLIYSFFLCIKMEEKNFKLLDLI